MNVKTFTRKQIKKQDKYQKWVKAEALERAVEELVRINQRLPDSFCSSYVLDVPAFSEIKQLCK